jgi:predicted nucleic acid-binding Zn ribbon protein
MAKKTRRRKRTFSEKVIIVMGILIAISMVLSLVPSAFQ